MPLPAPDADETIPADLQAMTRYMQQKPDDDWWMGWYGGTFVASGRGTGIGLYLSPGQSLPSALAVMPWVVYLALPVGVRPAGSGRGCLGSEFQEASMRSPRSRNGSVRPANQEARA